MPARWLQRAWCPLRNDYCKGSSCALAISLSVGSWEPARWVCGLVRERFEQGRVVVDVTEDDSDEEGC
jgi:hypothetical protein